MAKWFLWAIAAAGLTVLAVAPAAARPFTIDDLLRLHRVSDPQPSPDGKWVAYVVTDEDKAQNRSTSSLWMVHADGGAGRALTHSTHHDSSPRWSPDGRWMAFESDRSGNSQIWLLPVTGGEPHQLTQISTDAGQPMWNADGSRLAFVSAVFPQFSRFPPAESDRLNRELIEARAKSKVKARLLTELLYRHWDTWNDGRRRHLFVLPVRQGAATGWARDVTPGEGDAVPTSMTFEAGDEFAFSPDGAELAYTAAPFPTRIGAWSTNHDIMVVDLTTGQRRNLTAQNPAADGYPRYSPNGRWLAYRAQSRPGVESDRWQLFLVDRRTGARRSLTGDFDSSVDAFNWSPGSDRLTFNAEDRGRNALWEVLLDGRRPQPIAPSAPMADRLGSEGEQVPLPNGDLVFVRSSTTAPADVWRAHRDGDHWQFRPLTQQNETLFRQIDWAAVESVSYPGAHGDPVQMWIVKPPGFDPSRRSPLVLLSHGGPQAAWTDAWSYRWNPALWAAQGYVIAIPNFHGSNGFGQAFADEISRDWGGAPYEDIMAGVAYMKAKPYIDPSRMAAAGASYGGYMMNWLEGHTNEFRTIVTHDGVYDFTSMYGTTEELWFEESEHGQPWSTPGFDRFSPHRFAASFQTPMLVIHNELDFRVPIGQGQELFTTLQRRGIPSQFLSFPDEGHWVLKPANSELWHQTVFAWLHHYLLE